MVTVSNEIHRVPVDRSSGAAGMGEASAWLSLLSAPATFPCVPPSLPRRQAASHPCYAPSGVPLLCRQADPCHAARRSPAPSAGTPRTRRSSPALMARREAVSPPPWHRGFPDEATPVTPPHPHPPKAIPQPPRPLPSGGPTNPCYAARPYPCSAARQIPATPSGVPLRPERRDTPHAPVLPGPHGTPRGGLPAPVASGLPR
jgi:hypothetical protein